LIANYSNQIKRDEESLERMEREEGLSSGVMDATGLQRLCNDMG
jgi:hypothetical protein